MIRAAEYLCRDSRAGDGGAGWAVDGNGVTLVV
jgi:hypothetical protein